jgi:hypothetical protein
MDNAGRLDLASRVFYYFRQQAGNTDPPAYEYLSDQDLMAALIGDMRHYADWRGVDFGKAVAAGNSAYFQHRAEEEYPYSLGEEAEHPQPRPGQDSPEYSASLARRGIVTSIYPERDGTQTYYVRFLGETGSQPLKSADLQPAPAFPRVVTSQEILESLAQAERLLVETGARIRSCQLRDTPPAGARHHRPGHDHSRARPGMRSHRRRHLAATGAAGHGVDCGDRQTMAPSSGHPPHPACGSGIPPARPVSHRPAQPEHGPEPAHRAGPACKLPQAQVSTAITSRQRPRAI